MNINSRASILPVKAPAGMADGNISSLNIIRSLFIPSFISLIIALLIFGIGLKGNYSNLVEKAHKEKVEPGARLIFFVGMGGLIFVPIFKALTGLPPFMGMLIVLSILWMITDFLHNKHATRQHLRVTHVLTRIDTSAVLFFLGILLCISALDTAGLLKQLAIFLEHYISNISVIAFLIGIISAIIDNVPLVAATMGMYSLEAYPQDSSIWVMIAYCAGTGGSILLIGSAAGVAFMGLEKVDFLWYLRKIGLIASISYFAGFGAYLLQYHFVGF